jgi:hypothetical protein
MKTLRTPKAAQVTPCLNDYKLPHGALNGATRLRKNWRGKLILQVAVKDSEMFGPEVRRFWRWRDATAGDLQALADIGL